MAIQTNFASLFENLKLEDPWLPPRPWESIPSQSGLPHSSASTSQSSVCTPLYENPIVSEASLVRLATNALQGMESALLTVEKLCATFYADPADRTFHRIPCLWNRSSSTLALGKMLKSIGCSGCIVFLLRKFVDHFTNFNLDEGLGCVKLLNSEAREKQIDRETQGGENRGYSLVNQAFAVAVRKVLEGYQCSVDTLYASVGLRRSSKTVDKSSCSRITAGCLMSSAHTEVSLLEVYLHTAELRTQIEALGNICNIRDSALCFSVSSFEGLIAKAKLEFHNYPRGGDLLTYLYTQLRVADLVHSALLKFLFLHSCEPYCEFIRSWIYKANICDPYKEFLIEHVETSPFCSPGEAGSSNGILLATIREQDGVAIPCFLKDFSIPLLRAGQQLQVLMKLLQLCTHAGTGNHEYEDVLPYWSDFLSDYPSHATPLTFNKGNIEAMVLARNNYYKRMLKKLDVILMKLEIRHQQISPSGNLPVFGDNSRETRSIPFSFNKDVSFVSASTEINLDVAVEDMNSEASGSEDEFSYVEDQLESSECSSSNGSEEKNQSELQFTNNLACEHRYLSALDLFSSIPTDCSSQKPCPRETNSSDNALCSEAEKSNWSWFSGAQYIDGHQSDAGPLFGGPSENPFCVERRSRHDTNLHPSECRLKASTKNIGVCKDVAPSLSSIILTGNSLTEETNDSDQLLNCIRASSNSFFSQQLELNYCSNLLSMNPILSKNDLTSKHRKRCCPDQIKPFPYFDFSSVRNPCNLYFEYLPASSSQQFGSELTMFKKSDASAAIGMCISQHKEGYDGRDILVDKIGFPGVFTLEPKNEKKEDMLEAKVSGGSGWQHMLSCLDYIINSGARDQRNSLESIFEIPIDFVIEKCLLQEILLQYSYVSKLTIKLLDEGFYLQEHLLALRRYHFMELADWADLFIMSLWHHKWYVTEADRRVSEIQGLLEMSVQRSSCERDHYKDRLFVYIKGKENSVMPLSTSSIGVDSFDFLGLGYRVDWPVSIVLTPGALRIYAQIFTFLVRIKLAVFSLTEVWCSLKDLHSSNQRSSELYEPEMQHFNILMSVRHQVNHFVCTLQQYVQSQLSHVSWCKFLDCLKHQVKDMMDLESVHMAYLTDSLHICFLSDEMQSVAGIIKSNLQCALDFRSCLSGDTSEAGVDGGLLGRGSRINISQVLAIKQTFDKNIKELYLCYLKAPRRREYGLSHFWGYLNYNEYYSDVSNQNALFAFSI